MARFCFGGFDEVCTALGNAVQDRTGDLRSPSASREAQERATGPEVPRRGAEAEECRDEGHAICRRARCSKRVGVRSVVEETEVIAEPLNAGTRREHDGLEAPEGPTCSALGDNGEGAMGPTSSGARRIGTGDHVEHAPGAEGDLGVPWCNGPLANE